MCLTTLVYPDDCMLYIRSCSRRGHIHDAVGVQFLSAVTAHTLMPHGLVGQDQRFAAHGVAGSKYMRGGSCRGRGSIVSHVGWLVKAQDHTQPEEHCLKSDTWIKALALYRAY